MNACQSATVNLTLNKDPKDTKQDVGKITMDLRNQVHIQNGSELDKKGFKLMKCQVQSAVLVTSIRTKMNPST